MTKTEAADIFGNKAELARALGITRQAINNWPEQLTQRQTHEVLGAAVRTGLLYPWVASVIAMSGEARR